MSITSKSPRRVALAALAVAQEALPLYAHQYAPKKFTQPQLFACLVLKRFFKVSYRGLEAYLRDMPALCQGLGLAKVPDHSTFEKAEKRLLKLKQVRLLLEESNRLLEEARKTKKPKQPGGKDKPGTQKGRTAAADSTGMDADHRSQYYTQRRGKDGRRVAYRRFPKLTLLVDTASHMILSLLVGKGPRPDVQDLGPLLDRSARGVVLHHVLADAGFDSEANHTYCREEHGVLTTIPPGGGRPSPKPPAGRWRRVMKRTLGSRKKYYGQRWQVETVNSMIKRNQGSALRSRQHWAQMRELALAALTHNIAILL